MTAFVGVGGHIRLIFRRDRWLLPLWVLLLGVLPASYASATKTAFPTPEGLASYAQSIATNPSLVALYGPVYNGSLGQVTVARSSMLFVFVAIASLLTVIRHTRTEEDAGRRELLGSTVASRPAPLLAALIVVFGAGLALGGVATSALLGAGLPAAGSLALGLAMTTVAWLFGAIGGLSAQLTEGAGAARGIGIGVAGVAFVMRFVGDSGGVEWLSWLSPFGWITRTRAFAGEEWWVPILPVVLATVVTASALVVLARRDFGAGILPPRLGPAQASDALSGPIGLAWRLQRGPVYAWVAAFGFFGLAFGGVASSLDTMFEDNPGLHDFLDRLGAGSGLVDLFVSALLNILALAAAAYGIQAALRARTEETSWRSEPVLATGVGRTRWLSSHLVFGIFGPVVVMVALGLGFGLGVGLAVGDVSGQLPRVLAGALVQVPAAWILSGITVALFGIVPKLASLAWAFLAAFLFLGQFGALLELPTWVLDLSPFTHIPHLPGGEFSGGSLLALTAIAAALTGIGLLAFRRRDLTTA